MEFFRSDPRKDLCDRFALFAKKSKHFVDYFELGNQTVTNFYQLAEDTSSFKLTSAFIREKTASLEETLQTANKRFANLQIHHDKTYQRYLQQLQAKGELSSSEAKLFLDELIPILSELTKLESEYSYWKNISNGIKLQQELNTRMKQDGITKDRRNEILSKIERHRNKLDQLNKANSS